MGVASLITPRLYLSDYGTARNSKELEELGITHIISVIEGKPDLPEVIPEIQRHHLSLPDTCETIIIHHLDTTTAFIREALEENETNKVMVHCMQGVSRSATVVCAYLIATSKLSAEESIARVQSLRYIVCPNLGFRRQLREYATRYVEDNPKPRQMLMPDVLINGGGVTTNS